MLTLRCPKENGEKAPNSAFYSPGWPLRDNTVESSILIYCENKDSTIICYEYDAPF